MKTKLIIATIMALGMTAAFADGHMKDGRMKKADADGDGQVTFAEFEAAQTARIAEQFARMDKDEDGILTADELQRPPRGDREGRRKGDRNPVKAVERFDQDGSGGLTLDELQGKPFTPDSAAFAAADADGDGETKPGRVSRHDDGAPGGTSQRRLEQGRLSDGSRSCERSPAIERGFFWGRSRTYPRSSVVGPRLRARQCDGSPSAVNDGDIACRVKE